MSMLFENFGDTAKNLISAPAQLQRAEGDFIKNGGIEQLNVGILKHQRHPAPEVELNFLCL